MTNLYGEIPDARKCDFSAPPRGHLRIGTRRFIALCAVAFSLTALPSSAQNGGVAVVTVNPQSATRGDTIRVSPQNFPRDPSSAQILLDDIYPLCTHVGPSDFEATIPALTGGPIAHETAPCDAASGQAAKSGTTAGPVGVQFVALGVHTVGIKANGRSFDAPAKLTINRPGQEAPQLQWITPTTVVSGYSAKMLKLYGDNFIVSPAEDNQIKLGGNLLHIVWDSCPADAPDSASGSYGGVHGRVVSPQEIDLCNLTYLERPNLDLVVLQGDRSSQPLSINVQSHATAVMVWASSAVLLGAILLVVALAYTAGKYRIGNKDYRIFSVLFLDPETSTFSLSKYQFYAWSAATIFSYTYYALCQVLVQMHRLPDIPSNLPGIIAIGAGTTIGSQVVTSIRGPKGAGAITPSLSDFVTSGGVAAPDRIQIFVWTTLGAIAFCLATLREAPWMIKDLPDMGQGWLYMMGLSSVGYLGGKLARQPGPVLTEMSITSGSPATGGTGPANPTACGLNSANPASGTATAPAPQTSADLSQPIAAAKQVLMNIQAALSATQAAQAPSAFNAAQLAINALREGLDKTNAQPADLLDLLGDRITTSDAAAQSAAAEFGKLMSAEANTATIEAARLLAEQAQVAAAAVQDLSDGVQQAISSAQKAAVVLSSDPPPPGVTNIELRGRNLATSATFEINGAPLPFRMLAPDNGTRAPQKIAAEPGTAGMASELRLTIAPALMVESDLKIFQGWFSVPGKDIQLAIINPDGQRAEISIGMPPGSGQSRT